MPTDFITSWNKFIAVFHKKYYPTHKMTKIRHTINHFRLMAGEPFLKYLEWFKDLLANAPAM